MAAAGWFDRATSGATTLGDFGFSILDFGLRKRKVPGDFRIWIEKPDGAESQSKIGNPKSPSKSHWAAARSVGPRLESTARDAGRARRTVEVRWEWQAGSLPYVVVVLRSMCSIT
jgi:hypothetical protein